MGDAFSGTGEDLQTIIDSGTAFIDAANANFDTTTALIRDSNTVLRGQIASESAIRTFARQLKLFSGSLAGSDADLRAVIDNGSETATELRRFLADNKVDLAELINELVTTGEVVVRHLAGVEQVLVLYPYVVEGGFTVVARSGPGQPYDAHFGMVLTDHPPVCHAGYDSTERRPPQNGEDWPMNTRAHCAEPPTRSNPRGAQNAPAYRTAPFAPVVASYDGGRVLWGRDLSAPDSLAPRTLGGDSWKWLFLQPLMHTN
jgi:phospholipid/cholesterol/gamma-HCH transport system substrate-binding protein